MKKFFTAAGAVVDREPGPHMTLLHGPRSGDLVRARRRHHVPAGPPERRRDPDHGLEHGRAAPRRLPVGDRGQGERRDGDARRPALHAHERDGRPARAAAGRHRHRVPRRGHQLHPRHDAASSREYVAQLHERARDHRARSSATRRSSAGFFSGWTPEDARIRPRQLGVRGHRESSCPAGQKEQTGDVSGDAGPRRHGMKLEHGRAARARTRRSSTRNCVFQILKRHFAPLHARGGRAGLRRSAREARRGRARRCADNSGRERTSAICYAVGWTQHTHGVQNIRAAAIIQLLLGNIGRPGGGILALRGHANIQGSTDIPTLYDILPGYIPMPHPNASDDLDKYIELNGPDTGVLGRARAPTSSACSRPGGARRATADNDFCFDYLPRIDGDHSHYPMMLRMIDGETKGFIVHRAEPGGRLGERRRCSGRRWRTSTGWSCATSPRSRRRRSGTTRRRSRSGEVRPQDIGTEVFFLPAAAHTEKDGTFTNTQRLLQWHFKAVEPPGDCRSDCWFTHQLGRRVRRAARRLAGSEETGRSSSSTWDYPTQGPQGEPDAEAILQEINGRTRGRHASSRDTRSSRTTDRPPAGRGSTPASTPAA